MAPPPPVKNAELYFHCRLAVSERELTEFCGKLGEFCDKLGEFALADNQLVGWEELTLSSLPGTRQGQQNSLSSMFETVLSETVFGQF